MRCVICKTGEPKKSKTTFTVSKGSSTFIVKNVPAMICNNCGEEYFDQKTTTLILKKAESSFSAGSLLEVRDYLAA